MDKQGFNLLDEKYHRAVEIKKSLSNIIGALANTPEASCLGDVQQAINDMWLDECSSEFWHKVIVDAMVDLEGRKKELEGEYSRL